MEVKIPHRAYDAMLMEVERPVVLVEYKLRETWVCRLEQLSDALVVVESEILETGLEDIRQCWVVRDVNDGYWFIQKYTKEAAETLLEDLL